jgi:hypothetical protein
VIDKRAFRPSKFREKSICFDKERKKKKRVRKRSSLNNFA